MLTPELDFVSHCNHRPRHLPEWPYNLFTMVPGKTRQDADQEIQQIANVLDEANRGSEVLYSTFILKKTGGSKSSVRKSKASK